jgi:hypothetical protein
MKTAKSKDETAIAFDSSGDGPPVVIVAGALSGRASNSALAELLAKRFTVLNYDRRGRGEIRSPTPSTARSRTSR